MRARMPHLQLWKGNWRVRKPIPKSVQGAIGRGQYLTRGLGTSNRAEADRLAIPALAEFQDIIERAGRGDWPPLDAEGAEIIAYKWAGWAAKQDPDYLPGEYREPVFTSEGEFAASVTAYLAEDWPSIKSGTKSFETVKGFARGECTIKKPNRLSATPTLVSKPIRPEDSAISASPYRFRELIDEWALERDPTKKTRDEFESKITKLIAHLGHDDAAQVKDTDLIEWKQRLLASGSSHKTVENHLMAVKTLFNFAEAEKKIRPNPASEVSFQAKRRQKQLGYDDADAAKILLAARGETEPHRRWVPWIAAFSGARLEEICGANVADVYQFAGIWCLDIRLDNRGEHGSLKNLGSERKVPLHPAVIEEGFLKYVAKLPKNGPLFPNLTPDRYGKRGGSGSKRLCRWIRVNLGMDNPRKAPNHAWRHRFKSVCRRAGIEEEYHEALTGHTSGGSEGRDYGEYEVQVLYREICKIRSPCRQPEGAGVWTSASRQQDEDPVARIVTSKSTSQSPDQGSPEVR
jgi:integrase